MSDVVIRVEKLSKRFPIGPRSQGYKTIRDTVAGLFKISRSHNEARNEFFWALRDVSAEIEAGEVVGIIGRNGAGKSTLLKVLSRITEPTAGFAEIRGRVGSLLEVGTGFHPELTGRENVFLNGAILGMRRFEIERKFDEIVAFADVEKFIDTPVKHYSSGMYLRLAFAVAANLEPEILLVDEVLAVGDLQFQEKCIGKMGLVAKSGRTVIFVSHNLAAVETLCDRLLVLDKGSCIYHGGVEEGTRKYLDLQKDQGTDLSSRHDRSGNGQIRFSSMSHELAQPGQYTIEAAYGLPLQIVVGIRRGSGKPPRGCIDVAILVKNHLGQTVTTWATFLTGERICLDESAEQWRLVCQVPALYLVPDRYRLDLWCAQGQDLIDGVGTAALLNVGTGLLKEVKDARKPNPRKHGALLLPHRWHTDSLDSTLV
jgi:lipopolysaccharide transport system ATP-binding protein